MCRHLLAGLLLVAAAPLLLAADAVKEKSIEQLIEQLGDRKFQVREQAAKAIEALGPDALPALRKAKDHRDLDVRRRIEKWIPEFEAGAVVAAKRVTLKLTNQPLRKALEEVAMQTGYKLQFDAKASQLQKACNMQLDNATFWEALDRICQEGKLKLNPEPDSQHIMEGFQLIPAEKDTRFVARHRAFRVTADSFDYEHSTTRTTSQHSDLQNQLAKPGAKGGRKEEQVQTAESFQLNFTLIAEPRLTIVGVDEPVLTEALDNQNRSLLARPGERHEKHAYLHRNHIVGQLFEIGLPVSAMNARSLKVIRGTLPVQVEKDTKALVVTEDIKTAYGKTIELNGLSFQVDLLLKNPHGQDQYDLFLTTRRAKSSPQNSVLEIAEPGEFELQDANGNRYLRHGRTSSFDGRTMESQGTYTFDGQSPLSNGAQLGPPAKLLLIKRTTIVYHVPFEFRDLPLR